MRKVIQIWQFDMEDFIELVHDMGGTIRQVSALNPERAWWSAFYDHVSFAQYGIVAIAKLTKRNRNRLVRILSKGSVSGKNGYRHQEKQTHERHRTRQDEVHEEL